jgi:NitT/TauT family transport system substrate-binding protein
LCLATILLSALSGFAAHADNLKIAIGQINTWDNQVAILGQRAGIFKKHGLVLEILYTQGAGETLQAVISGTDVGIGMGTVGALRAFAKGAPIRILSAGFTGTSEYWYVRGNSPLKSLSDTTTKNTISYSTNGASTHNIVLAFAQDFGCKATPIATGNQAPTLTQVLLGHVDIGWAAPPFGLDEIQAGKIRILALGNDVPRIREQTIRVHIVNANTLKNRNEVMVRLMRAYREALDWMYSEPVALQYYSEATGISQALLAMSREQFLPKQALLPDRLSGIDAVMARAVKLKFLDTMLTDEQLSELVQIPPDR